MNDWRKQADEAKGWLHPAEGPALYDHALKVANLGPLCEIGGYCGKSAIWLAAAASDRQSVLFSVDWHRGSPEMAANRECHDPDMVDAEGMFDSLPHFRRNLYRAGFEPWVVPVVGNSATVGLWWQTPLAFLFIDGAHDADGVRADYELWAHHIIPGGLLAFHDTTIPDINRVARRALTEGFDLVEQVETLQILIAQ